ncbi:hypothetical protein [Mycobacterium parmense]|uniref:Uncharacterized protein n=1 Tax=Mycobacterium parmense TaxID=185642 RepID=A0A7I7YVM0_9MYCO|nr:hypothetical protein [Mycobacterium parmense]MCV7351227.1 hypothetical protein [Mycobacterium parmense]ORW60764.1 hypothetical protein AWC20_07395 [Mycobacterium parmense]BBZ45322.1 hypothetical protein MPRM_26030 [Mycobacterium parmense]
MNHAGRWAAPVFGLLMVGLATVGAQGPAVGAGALAAAAVGLGIAVRSAATIAVLLSVAAIGLSGPPPAFVALSGLCAAAYLVCRHAVGTATAVVLGSAPTAVAVVGFSVSGLVATALAPQLPWLPLAAPLGALAAYVSAVRPFVN